MKPLVMGVVKRQSLLKREGFQGPGQDSNASRMTPKSRRRQDHNSRCGMWIERMDDRESSTADSQSRRKERTTTARS